MLANDSYIFLRKNDVSCLIGNYLNPENVLKGALGSIFIAL
jgi:hypothetical protein